MSKSTTNNQIQLKRIEIHSINDNESRVEVELCLNERTELVEKIGFSDNASQLMTIGLATLDCIKLLVPRPLECQINYVKQMSGKQNTLDSVETLIRVKESGKETLLNGSAVITESIYKATVLSLLNALARPLEKMIELQQQRERVGRTGALVMSDLINVETINNARENTVSKSKDTTNLASHKEVSSEELINFTQAKELFTQAEALIRKGNYAVAKQMLKEAIGLDNTQADYHCQLGVSLINLGENEEAEKSFLKAVEIDPNSAICQTELGLFYKEIGRIDKAQIALEKAVELGADARAKRALITVKELICVFDPEKEKFLQQKQELKSITGSLKTKNDQEGLRGLFLKSINTKTIAIFLSSILVLISGVIGAIYLYNYLVITTKNQISDADLENPRYKAIKIVSDFPSSKKGLSVGEQIEQYIKTQNIKEYTWVAAPEKNGEYLVVVTFNKDGKEETAIWSVDLTKKICRAESILAKQFSGS